MGKSFYIHTLGCKVNWCDSNSMAIALIENGWILEKSKEKALVYILNSCTVTEKADADVRKYARKAKIDAKGPRFVVVTGCAAVTATATLKKIPEIDLVVLKTELDLLLDQINTFWNRLKQEETHEKSNIFADERQRRFVKIQDGCDQFCAYCIVPFARGVPKSSPCELILKEVNAAAAEGIKEVILTGIHIARYDDNGKDLQGLLREILLGTKIERIRLGSLESEFITSELMKLISSEERIMPHLHIPLQSGSNKILIAMNRKSTREQFCENLEAFQKLKLSVVSLDIIVGFPGETEQDFLETLQIIEKYDFIKIHAFPFSARKGTKAAEMKKLFVKSSIIKERMQRLKIAADNSAQRCRTSFLNYEFDVLVESNENGRCEGFTQNYIRVAFDANVSPRQIVKVKLGMPGVTFLEQ